MMLEIVPFSKPFSMHSSLAAVLFSKPTLSKPCCLFSPIKIFGVFEDYWVLEERNFNMEDSRIESNWWTIKDNGRQLKHKSSVRLYSFRELIQLFRSIGFKNFSTEGSYEGEVFELGAERLLLVAEK